MNPFEDNTKFDIKNDVENLAEINKKISDLTDSKKKLEKKINDYFSSTGISEYKFEDKRLYHRVTNTCIPIQIDKFSLKVGVDPEDCKITIPFQYVKEFAETDSNGMPIDKKKIKVTIPVKYIDKYNNAFKQSYKLAFGKDRSII